jgi:hypothetical protein
LYTKFHTHTKQLAIILYNTVNNNDDERLQDPIFLLNIPLGTQKNLSENHGQYGLVLSERFVSPALVHHFAGLSKH